MGRGDPLLKEQPVWHTQQTFCFWKNVITQWHLFMETNRNTVPSHTAEAARGGSLGWEALPYYVPPASRERRRRRQTVCLRGRGSGRGPFRGEVCALRSEASP